MRPARRLRLLHRGLIRAWRAVLFRRRALGSRLAWPILFPAAWLWRRTWLRGTPVVAVTGSFGKTSTAAAAAAALGVPFTADRPNYGAFLAGALLRHRSRQRPAVVEVGISRRGQMRGYARLLRPDVVVLTAIGGEHLLSLGTLETVAAEKARLARGLRAGGRLVVNGDDPRCRAIGDAAAAVGARVLQVGYDPGCAWRIMEERLDWPAGTHLRLAGPGGGILDLGLRWVGRDLARCASMAAVAALAVLDGPATPRPGGPGPAALVASRLAGLAPLRARLEPLPLPGGAWLLCDSWKANWTTIEAALGELSRIGRTTGVRCAAVLGDIEEPQGSQTAAYQAYGRAAAQAAEHIVYLGNRFASFRAGVRQADGRTVEVEACHGVHEAARALRGDLAPGTVILVKGRHSQKLQRIGLLLRGETVSCALRHCPAVGLRCELCPRLRRQEDPMGPEPVAI